MHVAYDSNPPTDLREAAWDGLTWDIGTVDLDEAVLGDLRIDGGDAKHLAYGGPVGGEGVRYAVDDGSGWHLEVVEDLPVSPGDVTLAVGPHREPHIAYQETVTWGLMSAHCR